MATSRFYKVVIGACAVSGAITCYYWSNKKSVVFTSKPFRPGQQYEPPKTYATWDDNWDKRAPRSLIKPNVRDDNEISFKDELKYYKPRVARHVILIRHGQYNLKGETDEKRSLTDLGKLQAETTGKRLKELGFPYSSMIKSTMKRAQETGTIISQHLPQIPVIDCNFIREGMPIGPEPPTSWKPELYYHEDGARIEAAFRKYFHRAEIDAEVPEYVLVVCHSNVIRYFVCRALQFPAEGWLRISLPHASITWISISPGGRCTLRSLGDSGHMPPELITTT